MGLFANRMKLSDCSLNRENRERVTAELRGGEELKWAGTYGKLPRGVVSTLLLVNLLAVVLTAILVAFSAEVWLWLSVAIGALVPILSYLQLRAYKRTICFVTNHRVVWLRGVKRITQSLALTENMIRRVVMKQGGCGDIVFTTDEDNESCVFYNVPQVRKLVSIITELSAGR